MSERFSVNRRVILGVVAGFSSPSGAFAGQDAVRLAVDQLADALRQQHGGQWSAHVDAANGFVLVTSRTDLERPSG